MVGQGIRNIVEKRDQNCERLKDEEAPAVREWDVPGEEGGNCRLEIVENTAQKGHIDSRFGLDHRTEVSGRNAGSFAKLKSYT